MTDVQRPGAFYGANLAGPQEEPARVRERAGGAEETLNRPGAPQRPVEGAVTGPEAPPARVDHLYSQADLADLAPLEGQKG